MGLPEQVGRGAVKISSVLLAPFGFRDLWEAWSQASSYLDRWFSGQTETQVRQILSTGTMEINAVLKIGGKIALCWPRNNGNDYVKCLANYVMSLKSPLDYLPEPVKKVANGQIMDLVPSQVRQVVRWNEEAVRTVFSVGFELMHCRHRGHHHDLIRQLGQGFATKCINQNQVCENVTNTH